MGGIAVDWHPRDGDQSEDFIRQMQEYLRKLERLDRRFAHLGYSKKSPDAVDMSPTRLFLRSKTKPLSFDNRTLRNNLAVSVSPGNPRNKVSGRAIVRPGYQHPMWQEEPLMRAILQLGIEFWRGDDAGIYEIDTTKSDDWFFWLRWQRDGVETPIPDVKSAGTPSSTEPWLDGTLKTWPDHAPWKLMDAR